MLRQLSLVLCLSLLPSLHGEKPNILFIFTDDQSYRTVGCYPDSQSWVRTPNIDALAAQGIRFDAAYMGTWCMASRASLLTGRQPHAVESMRMEGKYPGSTYDPEQTPFWPKVFREQGYLTAHIGKWHTGTDTGRGRDWDYQIVWNRPGNPQNSRHYYQDQEITFQDGSKRILGGDFYSTDQYTDWAIDFLEGKDGRETGPEKPWYLWLCYGAVHGPFTPAPRHVGAYASAKVPVPSDIFPPRAGKPAWANLIDSFGSDPESGPMQTFAKDVQQYHEGVLALDEAVGRLLTALDQTGQRENTLVVFTSDQGFAWGQHGFRARKVAPYDANIRVPLIISQPGSVPEDEVCLAPVGGVDLVSTFFAQAGLEAPWPLHGTDLTPLLEEPSREWNQPTLISFQFDQYGSDTADLSKAEGYRKNGVPWYAWVRMGDLKYVLPLDASEEAELYHLRKDPEELTNLVSHPEYQEKRKELHAQLLAELRRTEAPFIDQL